MDGGGIVAGRLTRGEIWLYKFKAPDKRRPVVVLTRADVIHLLRDVMVAPVSSTIHGLPSEVVIGIEEGMKHPSAVNLDRVQTIEKARLERYVGRLGPAKRRAVCRALAVATGCGDE
jgi:mRNA interferase MazF